MKENTNKAIAVNTVILYTRLILSTLCGLLTTRFALQALGVDDFGLFSVVGSIISFAAIINTVMISTSQRYMSVAIGKGDNEEANRVFNVNLLIHICIAIITALLAFPLGEWYINRYINYTGNLDSAHMVFQLSMTGSVLSFIAVPYNALLIAKEKFVVFSTVDVISHILKLLAAISILYFFEEKLFVYSFTQAVLTAAPTLIFWLYCRYRFPKISKWNLVKDKNRYIDVLKYSGWISYGAIAEIGKRGGAAMLVNAFFNTVMNAALGVATTISNFINMFAGNVTQPMAPQIMKSYAAGDFKRCQQLVTMSTKFAFLSMLLVSSPFFSDMEWIMHIWLGKIPPYAILFGKLLIIDALVLAFNQGLYNVIYASGKIAFFQTVNPTVKLLSIVCAFLVLKTGSIAYAVFYVYIIFDIIIVLTTQIAIKRDGHVSNYALFKDSYLPSILVAALYVPILFVKIQVHPLIHMSIVLAYLFLIVFFIGFRKSERQYILKAISTIISKFLH